MLTDPQTTPPVFASTTDAQQMKVLLVDDMPENLVSLESMLSTGDESISYLTALSGEEALKIALQEELALILLDVQMPGMNGYEVARYLRDISKTRDIPIIFVTAINEQEVHVIEGFEAGAVDFLFKPLHPYITRVKVANFVRFFRQKKELEYVHKATLEINQQLEERVKERTKELTKVNKDLDNFVYTASHDLKAPISNIEGLVKALYETLQEKEVELSGIDNIMDMIDSSIGRFKATLRDLTEVAKINYEDATPQERVLFSEVLDDVKLSIKDLILKYDATITEDFSAAPDILFFRKNLRSILYNLVSNSIKYSSPLRKPEIKITTTQAGEFTLLTVQDNGLGVRKQDKDKVFDMFRRLHGHVEGTGVGLAIVKRIVENCEGRIELDDNPDGGCTFKLYLK
ncbi:hybrid sensor histidine kinase/response regulator [Pontibacter sp. Tf4]|uniref:sensor histidine kinase n=1 Tax=Pontibacter sp. Tf4 TaxID=2761620 RepID=UPI001625B43C|nr:hybrid sensor histidine kinase/response regulator [Pontibacter sp. Tf4]MBB6612416.1 hybrid sensor histidine kinase/response regulator [Pontibacter sp. Tf4]